MISLVVEPFAVYGEQQIPQTPQSVDDVSFHDPANVKTEIPDQRTAFSKRYKNPDGTFTEELYNTPIHYKDPKNEKWIPIDSALEVDASGNYKNKSNLFGVRLRSIASSGFVEFNLDNTRMSFRSKTSNPIKGEVRQNKLTYAGAMYDTDLTYTVHPLGLKEDIVIKSPKAASKISFDLKLENLTLHQKADGSIDFYKIGETTPIYQLTKPFMEDAQRHYSEAVSYQIKKEVDGEITLDVVADSAWLQSSDRTYPVVIDPSVQVYGQSELNDTFVESLKSGSNFSNYYNNLIGNCVDHGHTRALYKFNLKALPSGSVIQNATFSVHNNTTYEPDVLPVILDVHPMLADWKAEEITWSQEDEMPYGPVTASYTLPQEPGWWNIPLTNLVQNWYNAKQANFGIKLQYRNESQVCRQLTSAQDPVYGQSHQPYLTVNYTIDGLGKQPYWTYDGSVNMANRNMVKEETDIHFPGRQISVALNRVYNSRAAGIGAFGYGWSSVIDMKIYTTAKGPARFVDGQGTVHYFNQRPDGTYEQLPGLHWKLTVSGSNATITTPEQNRYTFVNGLLTKTQDAAGNGLTYTHSGNQTAISDGAGYNITVNLSGGRVVSAVDPANRLWTYSYDVNGNLVRVKAPDGSSTVYRYDNMHNLIAEVSPLGNTMYYAYTSEDQVVAVSPVNAVINSNFEVDADGDGGPDHFFFFDGHRGISLDKASGSSQMQAAKITVSSTDPANYKVYVSEPITVDPAKIYTLSGNMKAVQTSGSQTTVLSAIAFDANGARLGEFGRIVSYGSFDWKSEHTTIPSDSAVVLPSTTKTVRVKLAASNSTGAGSSWFDAVQFEEGPQSTEFISGVQYTAHTPTRQSARYDGDGNKELYTYNEEQNLIRHQKDPGDLDHTEEYVWTQNDISSKTDGNRNTWSYSYDGNGNLTNEKDPLNENKSYTYDSQSNVLQFNGPRDGEKFLYTYDSGRHQKTTRDPYYTSQAKGHDNFGNMINTTTPLGWADNLIENSGFEGSTNSDGTPMGYSIHDGEANTWNVENAAAYGARSLKLTASSSNTKNYVALTSKNIPVNTAEHYVLSGYLKATQESGQQNTILSVLAYNSNGGLIGEVGRLNPQVQINAWEKWSTSILPGDFPFGTSSVRVKMAAKNETGTGQSFFDAVQLQQNPVDTEYNLIENSSFEIGGVSGVSSWTRWGGTGTLNWLTTPVYAGVRSVAVVNATQETGFAPTQYIPYEKSKNYNLSAFVKASGLSANVGSLKIERYDANKVRIGTVSSVAVGGSFDWKRLGVELQSDLTDSVTAYIRPVLASGNATGTIYYDNVRLQAQRVVGSYVYDPASNYTRMTQEIDPLGNKTSFQYDAGGNVVQTTSPMGHVTKNLYDQMDRLVEVTLPGNTLKVVRGYDFEGNLKSIDYKDPSGTTTYSKNSYLYNRSGQLQSSADPLNRVRNFYYTPGGRLQKVDMQVDTKEELIGGVVKEVPIYQSISYKYGKTGLLNNMLYDNQIRYSYGYDSNSNLKSVLDHKQNVTWSADYDPLNRLIMWKDGKGTVENEYDKVGNLKSKIIVLPQKSRIQQFEYNLVNQPTKQVDDSGTTRFLFDEIGKPSLVQMGNGVTDRRTYDRAGEVTKVQNQDSTGKALSSYVYEYDRDGNIKTITDDSGQHLEFEYNQKGQLTIETLPNGNIVAYEYGDALGNRTKRTETNAGTIVSETTYQYDSANELKFVNSQEWSYNDRGYLLTDGLFHFEWDVEGRLSKVTKSDDADFVINYEYDYMGRRVKQTVNSQVTMFLYDGKSNRVVAEYDQSGVEKKSYTWGPNDQLLSLTAGGATYYTVRNGHGDIVQLTDGSGRVAAWYQYDAWGNMLAHSEDSIWSINPYRYAGYRYDDALGLYFLNARYYNPQVGRFLSADPIQQTMDYQYSIDNPLRFVDPTGLKEQHSGTGIPQPIGAITVNAPKAKTNPVYGFEVDFFIGEAASVAETPAVNLPTRRQSFRDAKRAAGIPTSQQYDTHGFVYDGSTENRTVFKFSLYGENKYIILHRHDKLGRGPHFHGADDKKGNPFEKGRYNQYDGHFPEDFNGFK